MTAQQAQQKQQIQQTKKKKILIIEDDRDIAFLERDYLEINGYATELAFTRQEAQKLLGASRSGGQTPGPGSGAASGSGQGSVGSQGGGQGGGARGSAAAGSAAGSGAASDPALILLDIMLPGADGLELLKYIRNERSLDVPILIVSARKSDADKILGLGLGADDYIVKPFSPSELVARVKAHIERYERLTARGDAAAEGRREIIEFRTLKIDVAARRVFISGKDVALTNKEFDLLVFFARNPNRVFKKDDIFDKVWGMDAFGDTSTITVHVKKLREKIEGAPDGQKFIETVWGAGYRFKI